MRIPNLKYFFDSSSARLTWGGFFSLLVVQKAERQVENPESQTPGLPQHDKASSRFWSFDLHAPTGMAVLRRPFGVSISWRCYSSVCVAASNARSMNHPFFVFVKSIWTQQRTFEVLPCILVRRDSYDRQNRTPKPWRCHWTVSCGRSRLSLAHT